MVGVMAKASLEFVSREPLPSPPPLEANDQLVTAVITGAWAVALVVLLVLREQIPPAERWWIWVCVAGVVMGLFALWYVPRLKRSRARSAARRAQASTPQP
jgi:drug/metabolite transporter (DMT)-like permease